MKKKIFLTLLFSSVLIASNIQEYIKIKSSAKLGKQENGNYFMDINFLEVDYSPFKYLSINGNAKVGFTAPRGGSWSAQNHYVNSLNVRTVYKPLGRIGYFVEANFSKRIPGNDKDVSYFITDNYQAVGIEIEFLNSL